VVWKFAKKMQTNCSTLTIQFNNSSLVYGIYKKLIQNTFKVTGYLIKNELKML